MIYLTVTASISHTTSVEANAGKVTTFTADVKFRSGKQTHPFEPQVANGSHVPSKVTSSILWAKYEKIIQRFEMVS